jgi:hypothetical protein
MKETLKTTISAIMIRQLIKISLIFMNFEYELNIFFPFNIIESFDCLYFLNIMI